MELIPISGAELYYDPHFLSPEEASRLLNLLMEKCAWERRQAAFGHAVPRDEAYYGDPGAHYTYSRREYKPLAWIPELLTLKARVEAATPEAAYSNLSLQRCPYNAVLCNLYRDGNDSVGLHADNEPEMGPIIASVSLGAERLFRLRRNGGGIAFLERLCNGSLLIMAGHTQEQFKHEVPKEPSITQPRVNVTFWRIEHK